MSEQANDAARLMIAALTAAHISDDEAFDAIIFERSHRELVLMVSGLTALTLSVLGSLEKQGGSDVSIDAFLQSFGADVATGKFGRTE